MHATDPAPTLPGAEQQPTQLEIDHIVSLYEQGEHAQMEAASRALLDTYPDSALAWSVLGTALQLQGKDALPALYKTAALAPDDAPAQLNLGNAQLAIGQLDLAIGCFVRALEIEPAFAEALSRLGDALQAQGHITEAAGCYRGALEIDPALAIAHIGAGDILRAQRQHKAAEASYLHALTLAPGAADIHRKLGDLQLAMGRHEQAILSYSMALQAEPANVLAHAGLADVLFKLGRFQAAATAYGAAVQYGSTSAAHFHGLGRSLHATGNLPDAETAYRRAIELDSSLAPAMLHYADLLRETRRKDQAIAIYQATILLDPKNTDALNNLGMALQDAGKLDQAMEYFQQVRILAPGSPVPHCNIGSILQAQGKKNAAIESYRRALKMDPLYAGAHFNLGSCLGESGQHDDAIKSYERAIKLDPQSRQAHANLSATLSRLGRSDEVIAHCKQALAINPDWDDLHSNMLFYLCHSDRIDAAALFAEHLRFGEHFEAPLRASWPRHANNRDSERRLRIGFVSADLYHHAVANFITPIMEQLSRSPRLEMVVYANSLHDDQVSRHLHGLVSVWRQVEQLSHAELAQLITSDAIDILIDLSGHTGHNRLLTFARKPAPLQASWIGYPGTTGLQAMDYYLTDRFFTPPELLDARFTEKLLRLPASAPFLPAADSPPVSPLPAIENGYVTFGSFNRLSKLNREVIKRWSQLLHAVPNAKLLIGGMPNKQSSNMLRSWFVQEGIAVERLSFHAHTNTRDYLDLHRLVDICLDTFPYTGGTTTLHALWMGVPTLTITGSTLPERTSETILRHVNLSEFIARDAGDFIQKGKLLAGDIAHLAILRAGMRERIRNSAISQPALISAGLEQGLRTIWQRWCLGLPHISFEAVEKHDDAIETRE